MIQNSSEPIDRFAAWRWGAMIVGMLGLQVALGVVAIVLATGDQSVAVIPDYYQKALNWDQEIALRDASRALGWQVTYRQAGLIGGQIGLQLVVTDKQGMPIKIASGRIQLYRKARAGEVYSVDVLQSDSGRIDLDDCFDHHGLWEVRVDVSDASGNRFVDSNTVMVDATDKSRGFGVE